MLTKKDYQWISLAKKLVINSNHSRYKMIAILVKGSRILNWACNKETSAPPWYIKPNRKNFNLHAELAVLKGILKENSKDCTLYIYGISKSGKELKNTKPCDICLAFIYDMMVKRIIYVSNEEFIESKK